MKEQKVEGFGSLLTKIKIDKEITYREISEATGLSIGYLCDIAMNRRQPPEMKFVQQIEKVLCITDRSLQIAAVQSRKPTYSELESEISNLREKLRERDEIKFALQGMVAAFDVRPLNEPSDITETTRECAIYNAKEVLGWLEKTPECDHKWVDARNEFIQAGEFCKLCGLLRAGNSDSLKGEGQGD